MPHTLKKAPCFLLAAFLAVFPAAPACHGGATEWRPIDQARNVIVLIPDGCPPELVTLSRLSIGRPLALDAHLAGTVRTHSANSLVTDSAAAATALACGVKTSNGAIGLSAAEDARQYGGREAPPSVPLANLVEAARLSGRAVGIVVTSNLNDATPAAFTSHARSRKDGEEIIDQMVLKNLDVALGGGWSWMLPKEQGGRRGDGRNLFAELASRGVAVVTNREDLASAGKTPLWGVMARDRIAPAIDRHAGFDDGPSLPEMTLKAISLLKDSPKGFFLLVEGSQVDWACHANDTAWALSEFLEFDAACRIAFAFADGEGRGETLVVACPDHGTGGLTIGREYKGSGSRTREGVMSPIARVGRSSYAIGQELGKDREPSHVAAQMKAWWGMELDGEAMAELSRLLSLGMNTGFAIAEIGWRFGSPDIGWTTHDHTGADVPLWSHGPGRPKGCIDNTDVAKAIAKAMGADLSRLGAELFPAKKGE